MVELMVGKSDEMDIKMFKEWLQDKQSDKIKKVTGVEWHLSKVANGKSLKEAFLLLVHRKGLVMIMAEVENVGT